MIEMQETSEQTIKRVLGSYALGRKLRELRLRKKIGLLDLAKHTGLSPSMLSQLETGKLTPTLPTLARIAMVFDVSLEHFFGSTRGKRLFSLIRGQERIRFPERPDIPSPSWFFECLSFAIQNKPFEVFLADFPVQSEKKASLHQHEGAEFVYVIEGSLVIRFEEEDHSLCAGDSVYFDPGEPHGYRSTGDVPARAMVVTSALRL